MCALYAKSYEMYFVLSTATNDRGKSVNNPQYKLCVIEDFETGGGSGGNDGVGEGGTVSTVYIYIRIQCGIKFYGKIHLDENP